MNKKYHTPEGVKDSIGSAQVNKKRVEENIQKTFVQNGYEPIETPTLEFMEVYANERAHLLSNDMFKVLDRKGNILVIKPDFTPSIARAVSHLRKKEEVKVYSIGKTYRYQNSFTGKPNEMTQAGVEWVGDGSLEADFQIILLAIEALLSCGLNNFQIDIGEVNFFKGLLEEGGISEEAGIELQNLIDSKNYFAIEEVLSTIDLPQDIKSIFLNLPQFYGGIEIIEELEGLTHNEKAMEALTRLKQIYEMIKELGYEKYIAFDLSMIKRLDYYTGVLFRGVTIGTGEAVVLGGRYDELLGQFDNPQPAIGFGIGVDELMNAMSTQDITLKGIEVDYLICYEKGYFREAISVSHMLRQKGKCVDLRMKQKPLDDYKELCTKRGISHLIYEQDELDLLKRSL